MHDWNTHYERGTMPWDSGVPEPCLVEAVQAGRLPRGRAVEIGCGTGTDARYLAEQGYEVLAVDVASKAIELARAQDGDVRYAVHDLLAAPLPTHGFDLAFDRGCFHTFDSPEQRALFASRVAEALRPGGMWLCLAGSTEGPPRDTGPPRRSARDLALAIEPALELLELRRVSFAEVPGAPAAWFCLSRRR